MKITLNQDVGELSKRIEKDFGSIASEIVSSLAIAIEKGARKNFNSVRGLISSDDDYVSVVRYADGKDSQTVACYGDQVLFIEFGVGNQNKSVTVPEWTSASYEPIDDTMWSVRFKKGGGYERPAFGFAFKNNWFKEIAPRPAGIVELGHFGEGYGMDTYWIRPSKTGIPNTRIGESHVHIKDKYGADTGRVRTDIVWTMGHQPTRALWRAILSAERSLRKKLGGK